jgi:hypothetical protein
MVFSLGACSVSVGSSSSTAPAASSAADSTAPAADATSTPDASSTTEAAAPGTFHIGIATGTTSQSEDELRGAEAFMAEYGSTADGGIVTHVTYPDNFMNEQETTISQIVGLADDPLMKVIVVNQAIPGTVPAFKRIREMRPDILLLAGEPHEDASMIEEASDLCVNADNVARGYLIIKAAEKLGAKTFVHVSFPRHLSMDLLSRRRTIMMEACKDLGITFADEDTPDTMGEGGIPASQQYVLEQMPNWVEKYGKETVFFTTNDAQAEPMLARVAELGALFVESDLPSPMLGYSGAFGIDLTAEAGNWPAILKKVEQVVDEKGGSGRMGCWAYSYTYTNSPALAEFGKRIVEGSAKLDNFDDLMACYEKYTPGAEWNYSQYRDAEGNVRPNHAMLYQDTYIYGKGYMGMTKEVVPEKYFTLK